MTDAVAFWSVILPANGKEVRQEIESTETVVSTIHVTGMALGPQPKKGSHVITLEYNGVNAVLATLEDPHTRQFHMDIVVDQTAKFRCVTCCVGQRLLGGLPLVCRFPLAI